MLIIKIVTLIEIITLFILIKSLIKDWHNFKKEREMNVIIINEDNHGMLGVAKNMERTIQFLLDSGWLDENFIVIINGKEFYIKDHLGEDWCELIQNMNIIDFNEYFEGSFHLYVEQVY